MMNNLDNNGKSLTAFLLVFQTRFQRSVFGKAITVYNDLYNYQFLPTQKNTTPDFHHAGSASLHLGKVVKVMYL